MIRRVLGRRFRRVASAVAPRRADDGTWTLPDVPLGVNADYAEALPRYLTAFDPAFEGARAGSEFEFVATLLRVRGIQAPGWDPYETTLRAIPRLVALHSAMPDRPESFETSRHLQLWIWGHIVEASEPYAILANLLDVATGGRFQAFRFPPDHRGNPQGVATKIDQIASLARRAGTEGVASPLREIFDGELRNSIFHADYTLHGGEVRLVHLNGRVLSHDEVMQRVNRALAYHEALAHLYRRHRLSYAEPRLIDVHPAFSRDPDDRAIVMVTPGQGVTGLRVGRFTEADLPR